MRWNDAERGGLSIAGFNGCRLAPECARTVTGHALFIISFVCEHSRAPRVRDLLSQGFERVRQRVVRSATSARRIDMTLELLPNASAPAPRKSIRRKSKRLGRVIGIAVGLQIIVRAYVANRLTAICDASLIDNVDTAALSLVYKRIFRAQEYCGIEI